MTSLASTRGLDPAASARTLERLRDIRARVAAWRAVGLLFAVMLSALPGAARAQSGLPTAVIAGGNRTVTNSTGQPTLSVVVDGSGSTAVPPASVASYAWSVNGTPQDVAGATPPLTLTNGANTVTLVVFDTTGLASQPASVTITVVTPSQLSIQISGGNRTVPDTDGLPGERVSFSATATSAGPAPVTIPAGTFKWVATALVNGQVTNVDTASGTATPTLHLRDGVNTVTLTVGTPGGVTGSAKVTVTVQGTPAPGTTKPISSITGLSPNQAHVAQALEQACNDLTTAYVASPNIGSDRVDLLQQCRALIHDHAGAVNVPGLEAALDALSGQQITEMQRVGLDFADSQFKNLGDRLTELRGGLRGVSASGLQIQGGGLTVPVDQLAQFLHSVFGGGAGDSAPEDSASDQELLRDRLGFFITGNLRIGNRGVSANESAFDSRADSLTLGADYRITDSFVLGVSFGYGHSDSTFSQPDARLDSKNRVFSLYGSWYRGDWYLDFMASIGRLNYDSSREVMFASSVVTAVGGVVDRTATGSTNGHQTGTGASTGYDWHWGGLTGGPQVTLNYTKLRVGGYDETGASGLDLSYGEQSGDSFNARAGGHLSYAINTPIGVLLPHVQAAAVHEFASGTQAVSAHFSADAAAQFDLLTDSPDRNYFNWSAGASTQFRYGIAAFVDYQSFAGLARTTLHDTSIGLRIATRW